MEEDIFVSLHDEEGKAVPLPLCSCGSVSETCIQGIDATIWKCHKCLFGESVEAKLIYKPEFGS